MQYTYYRYLVQRVKSNRNKIPTYGIKYVRILDAE